ncbi:hypothetical protein GCM10007158_14490 [Vreelandella hamiltonii]|uniref:Uncharacterized protein n=1 Tax=Halomonas johnsoniae TaxID=502832 RepID=A0ABQ2WI43_9GAMM|nr:hypothetical protein GCM10007158_14490 [Halomonas johnsoniae]
MVQSMVAHWAWLAVLNSKAAASKQLRARVGSRGMQRMKWAPDNKRFI